MGVLNIISWMVGTLVVVLSPLALIHELGHFIFAKLAGVRVEEFGLGMPPRALTLWTGEGYLEIGHLPVRIPRRFRLPPNLKPGMHVRAIVRRADDGSRVLRHLEVLTPDTPMTPVFGDPDDFPLNGELTAIERGTVYSLNWIPMGAFVRVAGEEDSSDPHGLAAQSRWWRFVIVAAGPVFNLIAALLLIVAAYGSGLPERWYVEVTGVVPDSAAAEAGLLPGDIIVAAGEEAIGGGMEQLRRIIRDAPEQPISLTVLRDDQRLTLVATPDRSDDGYGLLGIYMSEWPDRGTIRYYTPSEALRAGFDDLVEVTIATVGLPVRVVQGGVSIEEARPVSPVGVVEMLALTLKRSIEWRLAYPVLNLAAIVSLAFGLTNFLPIPALDGGRLLFVFIEAAQGRRISPEQEAKIHMVGMVILISMSLFIMLMDLLFPIFPWSWLK